MKNRNCTIFAVFRLRATPVPIKELLDAGQGGVRLRETAVQL